MAVTRININGIGELRFNLPGTTTASMPAPGTTQIDNSLPVATDSTIGAVKPDGLTITVAGDGTITAIGSTFHDEPLTDGNGSFIFAATLTTGGDIIVVIGVPN